MYDYRSRIKLPPLGQRIVKTAVAVFLCLFIYYLRGFRGSAGDAVVAAIICVQPYSKDSKRSAINRIMGTVAGAFWGLLFLFVMDWLPQMEEHMLTVYLLMSVGLVAVLYTSILLDLRDAASLTAIIYICIIVKYPNIESPLIQTFDRVFDTTIGVLVAILINNFHLPREKQEDAIFFVRLQDLVEDRFSKVSPRVMVDLNRLYDEGAKIVLESRWIPAFLISQMGSININMPIIVMEGAAVYDLQENAYLDAKEMNREILEELLAYFEERDMGYCVMALRGNTMTTFLEGNLNQAEIDEMHLFRKSPYRHYATGKIHEEDHVLMVRILLKEEQADYFERDLEDLPFYDYFRISRRRQPRREGWIGFYFTDINATPENMEYNIVQQMSRKQKLPIEKIKVHRMRPGDRFYVPSRDAQNLLRRVRGLYMPIRLMKHKKNEA